MPLEVIGAGFGRTGTNSMKLALEQLGFGPCHHMFEVRDNPDRLVDWPGARYWRDLVGHYPKAKVILTVRDPDEWYDSVQKTIVPFITARGAHSSAHINGIADMGHETVFVQVFGDRLSDRAHAIGVFNDHIASVKKVVPQERLLVIDVEEGWEPLCKFLGVAIPDAPFPRTNSTREFHGTEWNQ